MSIIVNDLIEKLKFRMEDSSEKWDNDEYAGVLTSGQIRLCNLLHNNYLTELQWIDERLTVSGDGSVNISDLTYSVLKGASGIVNAARTHGSNATPIDVKDLAKYLNNYYMRPTEDKPGYYVFNNKVWFVPITIRYGDIWYLRLPDALAVDGTCLLNEGLEELLLDLSESVLWKADKKQREMMLALNPALAIIEKMNYVYAPKIEPIETKTEES